MHITTRKLTAAAVSFLVVMCMIQFLPFFSLHTSCAQGYGTCA